MTAVGENLDSCSDLGVVNWVWEEEGERCTSAISAADSRTNTEWPARRIEIAAPRPPRPAPTMITFQITGQSNNG